MDALRQQKTAKHAMKTLLLSQLASELLCDQYAALRTIESVGLFWQ